MHVIACKANIRLHRMVDNTCIDTSIQKSGIQGLSGWVEHERVINEIFKEARERMKNFAEFGLTLITPMDLTPTS